MTARFITTTETAKLIRAALKSAFPGSAFSVKSSRYSGGCHVSVNWTDGPTSDQVKDITSPFDGSTFDAMIDLKSYHDSEYQGEAVHFSNDGTNLNRSYSVAFLTKAVTFICKRNGYQMPAITESGGSAWIAGDYYVEASQCHLQTLLWHEYQHFSGACIDNLEVYAALADWLDDLSWRLFYPFIQAQGKAA